MILVVDDDRELAAMLRDVLERAGLRCDVAHDDREAWEKLGSGVSLVLLDIMMPGQTGSELLARIRAEAELPDIPVVFVTARADAETRIQCAAMGAADFIAKPVRASELVAKVTRILERRAGPAAAAEGLLWPFDPLEEILTTDGLAAVEDPGECGRWRPVSGVSEDLGEVLRRADAAGSSTPFLQRLLAERRTARVALAQQRRLLSALFRLHQTMRTGARPDLLGSIAVSLARSALDARGAALRVPAGDLLRPLAAEPLTEGTAIDPRATSAIARCWRQWLASFEERADGSLATHHPLTVVGEKIGVLSLVFERGRRPTPQLVGFFAAAVALALDSATRLDRARAEALTDPLTGIQNRRFLENRLAEEVQRARSFGEPLSMLFIDIDTFKRVNDSLGHDVGDQVLCALSGVLASQLRPGDTLARYGGDEFVVLLPETDREAAHLVAERLQHAAGRLGHEPGSPVRDITLTIGIACFPEDGARPADLLAFADAALRRGKASGRNRIERRTGESARPRVEQGTPAVLRTLLGALDLRDRSTGGHSRRVAALAARLARHLGCDEDCVKESGQGGLLHDVGKLHLPTEILRKPGPLDREERRVMEQHARIGAELTAAIAPLAHLAPAVRSCQEHWDGRGYPDGLVGEEIPLAARIIAVADAYDAMTSDRSYRLALPPAAVEAELRRCAGTQFDPAVVDAMVDLIRREGASARAATAPFEGHDLDTRHTPG